ncbi:hypothetical protein CLAIMM_03658 [Cladophialophora immunda]|nr:hypothetical protein CLAIMM_03658 [Cladophialophora immunda]
MFEWSDYVIWDGKPSPFVRSVELQIAKPSYALSVLGITGLTAYFGIVEVGKLQKGETIVISTAAGAVGSVAGAIAKIKGAKVIGLTSSRAKQDVLIQKLGFDAALNYRADDFVEQLSAATSGKLDVYFDCVGGELSQTIMKQMKRPARIVECGQISTYNDEKYAWMTNLTPIHLNGLRLEGYTPMLFKDKWPEALDQLQKWIRSGELVPLETEMVGLESLPRALVALLSGENVGKMLVTIKE